MNTGSSVPTRRENIGSETAFRSGPLPLSAPENKTLPLGRSEPVSLSVRLCPVVVHQQIF